MHIETTQLQGLKITLTAHEDPQDPSAGAPRRLLLATVEAEEALEPQNEGNDSIRIAVVIDRSGSMAGPKLEIVKDSVSRLVRSLKPEDRIGVVQYDDTAELVFGMSEPSPELARRVGQIHSGGSTDLYGGWLMGAKLVGQGGSVILLSDGLANVGRFTHAGELAAHAGVTYRKFGVATTTIGVGDDFDEQLMYGMAREGGGSHYFAPSVESVLEAFKHERFSIGTVAFEQLTLQYGNQTLHFGPLWPGEVKKRVIEVGTLAVGQATAQYIVTATRETVSGTLNTPDAFGLSEEATLQFELDRARELLEAQMTELFERGQVRTLLRRVRDAHLNLLNHPLSDSAEAQAVMGFLRSMQAELESLDREWDELRANTVRKRGAQLGHNLREQTRAYSPFAEDLASVQALRSAQTSRWTTQQPSLGNMPIELDVLRTLPFEKWRTWQAIPSQRRGRTVVTLMAQPRDGFLISEMERELGMGIRIRPHPAAFSEAEVLQLLSDLEGRLGRQA